MELQQYIEYYHTYKDWFLYSGLFFMVVSFVSWFTIKCQNTRLVLAFFIGVFGFICLGAANFDLSQINVTSLNVMPR